jgi:hypothetical protein
MDGRLITELLFDDLCKVVQKTDLFVHFICDTLICNKKQLYA